MDTPIEPGSPVSSASSDSIMDDVDIPMLAQPERPERSLVAAKRRLAAAGGRDRDTKARRRDESGKAPEGLKDGRPREEYLNVQLAEHIRKQIKDPFDEDLVIRSSS